MAQWNASSQECLPESGLINPAEPAQDIQQPTTKGIPPLNLANQELPVLIEG